LNIRGKLVLTLVGASFFLALPVFADSTSSFTFTSTLGNIGSTDTFTSGSLSVVVTGYSAPSTTSNLYAKNEGPTEAGIGLASGEDHEITGSSFVQLNLQSILASQPSSVTVGIGSIQGGDNYQIWGSNTAGTPGTLLASNQTAGTFTLPDLGQYSYISILSPSGTVLLDGLTVGTGSTATPEPGSAMLLLFGLGALAGIAVVAKK
jgi:hypothetical protein